MESYKRKGRPPKELVSRGSHRKRNVYDNTIQLSTYIQVTERDNNENPKVR